MEKKNEKTPVVKKEVKETKPGLEVTQEEKLIKELQSIRKKEFDETQKEVNEFLAKIQQKGFGLDASITVSRHGNNVNIFLVDIRR